MAVHTALDFVALGSGLLAATWSNDQSGVRTAPRRLPLFVGFGTATVTLCLWQALAVEENAQLDLIRHLAA